MTAPVCPINSSQIPSSRNFQHGTQPGPRPLVMPSIPAATDLPSLIRTVNVMRDVLRQLTTSLTVNNVYNPPPPFFKAEGDTYYSLYPSWEQADMQTSLGYVYHKDQGGVVDKEQRAFVRRINSVMFKNASQEDPDFIWAYSKPLDRQIA